MMREFRILAKTYHNAVGVPQWIATTAEFEEINLFKPGVLNRSHDIAGGSSEAQAVAILAELQGWTNTLAIEIERCKKPKVGKTYPLIRFLRDNYLQSFQVQDAVILVCLYRHHPRQITSAEILTETSVARQTARRVLNGHPSLIEVETLGKFELRGEARARIYYSLKPAGVDQCVAWLQQFE